MPTDLAPNRPRPTRCPQCSAVVRGDVPWCVACYAPLASQPDAGPAAEPEAGPAAEPDAGPPAQPEAGHEPDVVTAGATEAAPDVDALADRLLAELAATGHRPAWSRRLPSTRAGRAALVAGLLAACSAVLLLTMSLVGLVL
jgi:hypothetical protein